MVKSLAEIYETMAIHDGVDTGQNDKGTTHSYIPIYETLLEPYREKASVLEIGLALGKSLDLWGEYFGPESAIVGVDISVVFDVRRFDSRFTIVEADATKPEIVFEATRGIRTFDIIIDDGSHMQADQIATFNLLKHRMRPGGLYIIEDILALDISGPALTSLHPNCEVFDLRRVKGRFDDALIVMRF